MQPQSIIILGAGFGGLAAAKKLRGAIRADACRVTIINRESRHVFTPLLYESATAVTRSRDYGVSAQLASAASLRLDEVLRSWGVDMVRGDVHGIDWSTRQVLCGQRALRFDQLIIALGSETNFFDIAGLRECAYTLKSLADAERIRQRLEDLIACHRRDHHTIHIMIGGAGATGVELAAEMAMFFRHKMLDGVVQPSDFSLSLVEAQSRVLPMMHPHISTWAHERLSALGVTVHLDTCIKHLSRSEIVLAPRPLGQGETKDMLVCDFRSESEKKFETDMTVWTGGIRGSSTLEQLGLPLDPRGRRIPIDTSCRVIGSEQVYAIGDAALLIDPRTARPVPWLAQTAISQGVIAAKNILRGSSTFRFKNFATVVPLGGKNAAVDLGWIRFYGFFAWCLRAVIDLRYFMSVISLRKAIRMWRNGLDAYSRND